MDNMKYNTYNILQSRAKWTRANITRELSRFWISTVFSQYLFAGCCARSWFPASKERSINLATHGFRFLDVCRIEWGRFSLSRRRCWNAPLEKSLPTLTRRRVWQREGDYDDYDRLSPIYTLPAPAHTSPSSRSIIHIPTTSWFSSDSELLWWNATFVCIVLSVPPKITPFSFARDLNVGDRTSVQCVVVTGDLPLTFTWLKDNVPIETVRTLPSVSQDAPTSGSRGRSPAASPGMDVGPPKLRGPATMTVSGPGHDEASPSSQRKSITIGKHDAFTSALSISTIAPAHNGTYTCRVTNGAATVAHSALLHVNGKRTPLVSLYAYRVLEYLANVYVSLSLPHLPPRSLASSSIALPSRSRDSRRQVSYGIVFRNTVPGCRSSKCQRRRRTATRMRRKREGEGRETGWFAPRLSHAK